MYHLIYDFYNNFKRVVTLAMKIIFLNFYYNEVLPLKNISFGVFITSQ